MRISWKKHPNRHFHGGDENGFNGAEEETDGKETAIVDADTMKEYNDCPEEDCDGNKRSQREPLHKVISWPLGDDIACFDVSRGFHHKRREGQTDVEQSVKIVVLAVVYSCFFKEAEDTGIGKGCFVDLRYLLVSLPRE